MELKLTENQVNALINAYNNFLIFENLDIAKGLNTHLGSVNITPENINELEELVHEGELEAQDLFDWEERPEYFQTMENILDKLKTNNLKFDENEMYNIRNVTDLYSRLGQGQIKVIRDIYSNIKNVHIGGFVSFTNIFDKANKLVDTVSISKMKDEYKIAYDIHQVIRNHLAWKRKPEGGIHIDFDKPKKCSKEPLPYIHVEQPQIEAKSKRSNKPRGSIK